MRNPLPKQDQGHDVVERSRLKRQKRIARKYSQKLEDDVDRLYSEVMEAEAVRQWRLPGWREAANVLEHGLAAMVRRSQQEEDREIAYKAAGFLMEYGKREMEREGQGAKHGGQVMDQLEALYRKALPEGVAPLVEVVDERA